MRDQFEELAERLRDTHIPLTVDVQDDIQLILVKADLTVKQLTQEIATKFVQNANVMDYALFSWQGERLPMTRHLHELTERRIRFGTTEMQHMVSEMHELLMIEEGSGQPFILEYLPATIGRTKRNDPITKNIAVDLGEVEEGRSVSGEHARIFEQDGTYYIENLTEHNRVVVDEQNVGYQERHPLSDRSELRLGKLWLTFYIRPKD